MQLIIHYTQVSGSVARVTSSIVPPVYLSTKSAKGNLVGYPCRRILTVSMTPVYRSCFITKSESKSLGTCCLLGLIHLQ